MSVSSLISRDAAFNRDAENNLKQAFLSFRANDAHSGFALFGRCCPNAMGHMHMTYYFMWVLHKKPPGDPNYGESTFWDSKGGYSSNYHKAEAINLTLKEIEIIKLPPRTPSITLREVAMAASVAGPVIIGIAHLAAGKAPPRMRPVVPGHVTVGGGHMVPSSYNIAPEVGYKQSREANFGGVVRQSARIGDSAAWESFQEYWNSSESNKHLLESGKEGLLSAGSSAAGDYGAAIDHFVNAHVELAKYYYYKFTEPGWTPPSNVTPNDAGTLQTFMSDFYTSETPSGTWGSDNR